MFQTHLFIRNSMKKYILPAYAAMLTAAALYTGYAVYSESYFVLSAEQAENIVGKMNQIWFMYQSCRAGA